MSTYEYILSEMSATVMYQLEHTSWLNVNAGKHHIGIDAIFIKKHHAAHPNYISQ